MGSVVESLSADHHVLMPTFPGWDGQPRDPAVRSVADLARCCADLLMDRELFDVTVVASSFGGWVATELALMAPPAMVGRMVLLNPVGPEPTPQELAARPAMVAPAGGGPSMDLVRSYTGPAMCSPDLSGRLHAVDQPTLVLWGADDPVLPAAYGHRIAANLGRAQCVEIPGAGHLPHVDAPLATVTAIRDFLARAAGRVAR